MSEPAAAPASTTSATATTTGRGPTRWGTFATLYTSSLRSAPASDADLQQDHPLHARGLRLHPGLHPGRDRRDHERADTDVEIFKHEDYFGYVQIVLVLFCAAVAPELVRDQRNRMISLYFSRALSRVDYALRGSPRSRA